MGTYLRINTVKLESGGRKHLLINKENGLPLLKPTYYITSMFSIIGRELNTEKQALAAIKFTYEWAKKNQINLEARFKQGLFLDSVEVCKLCTEIRFNFSYFTSDIDFSQRRVKKRIRRHRPRLRKPIKTLNKDETTCIKLLYARSYLDWLARETISRISKRSPEYQAIEAARKEMIDGIEARIPKGFDNQLREGLKAEDRERLLEVIKPESTDNPFKSKFVRVRNQLFIRMLDHLGIRRAEALLIKINDGNLDYVQGFVNIMDCPTDFSDSRTARPALKTDERSLPLSTDLCKLISDYVLKYRSKIPAARLNGYLFVSQEGAPLSLSAADDICLILRTVPGIPHDLSNHLLRFTWNDRFSKLAAEKIKKGEWTISDEEEIRRLHQGWKEGSKMPKKYSRRFNKEKAREIGLKLQTDIYIVED